MTCCCCLDVDIGDVRDGAGRAAQPLPVLGSPAEGGRCGLGVRERGDVRDRAQRRRGPGRGQDDREDGLVGLVRLGCRLADRRADAGGLDRHRWHEQGDHGIDARIGENDGQSRVEGRRVGRAEHVDRVRDRCLGRKRGRQRRAGRFGELRQFEAGSFAGVGAKDAEATGVREHRHATTPGDGLAGEQRRDVEQAGERIGPDHSRLVEDRLDGRVRAGQGGGVRARCLLTGA